MSKPLFSRRTAANVTKAVFPVLAASGTYVGQRLTNPGTTYHFGMLDLIFCPLVAVVAYVIAREVYQPEISNVDAYKGPNG